MDELKPCPWCGPLPKDEGPADATRLTGMWNLIHRCRVLGPVKIEELTRENLIAAWNARAPSVPEGYTLVPVVPTPEMWEAFKEQVNGQTAWDVWSFKFGKAIAAPPKVPA